MRDKPKVHLIPAMAFYHPDGLVPAWKQASRFAGEDGRIATLPDVINARLHQKPGSVPWERYFTTRSAEYMGRTRGGNRILIVAHGVGPMATLRGIHKAYSFHFKDKTRRRTGGRITYEEFYALESGKYGEVAVVDLDSYLRRYQYPFIQYLHVWEAMGDPLVMARLGPNAAKYVERHAGFAREWHKQEGGIDEENRYKLPNWEEYLDRQRAAHARYARENSDPPIIEMGGASNCPYGVTPEYERDFEKRCKKKMEFPIDRDGLPIAHLLSIGGLVNCRLHEEDCGNLTCDVGCHEWWNGVRFAAVCGAGEVTDIHPGIDNVSELLHRNWSALMRPVGKPANIGFCALVKAGGQWFTQYPKIGERMDTGEPEFRVTSLKRVGNRKVLKTSQSAYPGFFKYGIREAEALAPQGANAYQLVGDGWLEEPEMACWRIEFYKVEVDTTKRLIRADELCNDYGTLMKLVAEESK